jgi:chaperone modulatory protein CbpM
MIRETELIAQFTYLERQVLLTWIEEGVIAPHRDEEGYLFDRVDESRVALACDLHYRMGLEHASLPVILSLLDQLHDARHHLRTLTRAVVEQPASSLGRARAQQLIAHRTETFALLIQKGWISGGSLLAHRVLHSWFAQFVISGSKIHKSDFGEPSPPGRTSC